MQIVKSHSNIHQPNIICEDGFLIVSTILTSPYIRLWRRPMSSIASHKPSATLLTRFHRNRILTRELQISKFSKDTPQSEGSKTDQQWKYNWTVCRTCCQHLFKVPGAVNRAARHWCAVGFKLRHRHPPLCQIAALCDKHGYSIRNARECGV